MIVSIVIVSVDILPLGGSNGPEKDQHVMCDDHLSCCFPALLQYFQVHYAIPLQENRSMQCQFCCKDPVAFFQGGQLEHRHRHKTYF